MGSIVQCLLRNCFEDQERGEGNDESYGHGNNNHNNNSNSNFIPSTPPRLMSLRHSNSPLYEPPPGMLVVTHYHHQQQHNEHQNDVLSRQCVALTTPVGITGATDDTNGTTNQVVSSQTVGGMPYRNTRHHDSNNTAAFTDPSALGALLYRLGLKNPGNNNPYGSLASISPHQDQDQSQQQQHSRPATPDLTKPPKESKPPQTSQIEHPHSPLRIACEFVSRDSTNDLPSIALDEVVIPGSDLQKEMALTMKSKTYIAEKEVDECVICMEEFDETNPRMPTLCGCGENKTYFHLPCLYQWIEQHDHCPSCRVKLRWEEF